MTPSELETPLSNGDIVRLLPLVRALRKCRDITRKRGESRALSMEGRDANKRSDTRSGISPDARLLERNETHSDQSEETAPVEDNETRHAKFPGPFPGELRGRNAADRNELGSQEPHHASPGFSRGGSEHTGRHFARGINGLGQLAADKDI